MKLDCVYSSGCFSADQHLGTRGTNGWETVVIPMQNLIAAGLDTSKVDTGIVIWATETTSTVFQIDNVRFTGFDEDAEPPVTPPVTVPFNLTQMGLGSYSDTINPASYRCVYDYGNWIYNAGVVEPGIPFCDTATGTPQGDPTPMYPHLAGAAANKHTMTHRWWGLSLIHI